MTYTRDNIVGLTFKDTTDSPFVVLAIEGERVRMGYAPSHHTPNLSNFHNELARTLMYFNDKTWKIIGEPVYAIY